MRPCFCSSQLFFFFVVVVLRLLAFLDFRIVSLLCLNAQLDHSIVVNFILQQEQFALFAEAIAEYDPFVHEPTQKG
jgi:hypothetical protein